MMRTWKNLIVAFIVFFNAHSCVEPFDAETRSFEDSIVVDALLTSELKNHRVIISRTFLFEEEQARAEQRAEVSIVDDQGTRYAFEESSPGVYLSAEVFAASAGRSYQLEIDTEDGRSYLSETVQTPENVGIDELMAVRETNDFGEDGVSIVLSNSTPAGESNYFRYEYEETYKIIAPFWTPFEFVVVDKIACEDGDAFEVVTRPEQEERQICYNTVSSIDIVQASTADLTTNDLQRFPVRFLNRNNYIISHRYSLLVTQYTQTPEAFSYYQNLKDFSSSESIFSERQPGFLSGNVLSQNAADEKVLGYFEVASVTRERVYFNYADLFPGEQLPPYAIICSPVGKPALIPEGYHCDGLVCDGNCESPLINQIEAGLIVYFLDNDNYETEIIEFGGFSQTGPFLTKAAACGDCRELGSNVVPEFWIE